jgi:hypothetical protein
MTLVGPRLISDALMRLDCQIARFLRFAPVLDLLLCAKYLFVAAMAAIAAAGGSRMSNGTASAGNPGGPRRLSPPLFFGSNEQMFGAE